METKQTKRMVFGDDRSSSADVAWLWINEHRWPGWQVDVVHVPDENVSIPPIPGGEALEAWTPDAGRTLFAESELAHMRNLTAHADPRLVLMRCTDADLLVIGSIGDGLLKRWLHLGSTAEWLLNRPPAPLLIAKSASPVRRVLVGIDGSESAQRALTSLLALPWVHDVEVLALGAYDGWTDPELALEVAAKKLAGAGVSYRTEQVRGRPTETILETTIQQRTDLVVLGTTGTSGIHRLMAGSTTSAVARVAACSVFTTA